MELTRINNDINGNPRYVVHFLEFINERDEIEAIRLNRISIIDAKYTIALKKAKKIGGKKFHNKQFGGGIVFQSYNTADLIKSIKEIREL